MCIVWKETPHTDRYLDDPGSLTIEVETIYYDVIKTFTNIVKCGEDVVLYSMSTLTLHGVRVFGDHKGRKTTIDKSVRPPTRHCRVTPKLDVKDVVSFQLTEKKT